MGLRIEQEGSSRVNKVLTAEAERKKVGFVAVEDDIRRLYKTEDEIKRVAAIYQKAVEETEAKKIIRVRPVGPIAKYLTQWYVKVLYGIHFRKPFYPLRLLKNYAKTWYYQLMGINKYVFRGMELAISFRCNFSCTHCLCSRIDESDTRREMTEAEYAKLIKEAMALGATTFGLEGGEPILHKNWRGILKTFQPKKNHIIISTNGSLIDEPMLKEMAEIGVDTINFSVDSGIPELHDLFRRRVGAWNKVVENILLSKKYGIKPLINVTLHKGNMYTEGFIKLLEFAETNKVMINVLFAKGVGSFKDRNSMLDDEDFKNYWEIVKPYAWVHIHHQGNVNYNYGCYGCPGAKEMFNMTPYGDVINCANMHIYFGNVLEEPLAKIRERVLRETPLGRYRPTCYLTQDKDFMAMYYPALERNGRMTLNEFKQVLRDYEAKTGRIPYPELRANR